MKTTNKPFLLFLRISTFHSNSPNVKQSAGHCLPFKKRGIKYIYPKPTIKSP